NPIRVIANHPDSRDELEYRLKEAEEREDNLIPLNERVLFFEVYIPDASEFSDVLKVTGVNVNGYRVLRAQSPAVPNAIAAFLLYLRDKTGKIPHVYFDWSEGNPFTYLLKYILFGEGYTAPVTREILRKAEPDPARRPTVHVSE
ncbi:MAG TPA: amino acid transporter, partial [Methylomirabilota bacterium]|nr:amino acid transporter [Methylomirabilota bacterium]